MAVRARVGMAVIAAAAAGCLGGLSGGVAAAAPAQLCDTVDANQMCQLQASGPYRNVDIAIPADYPEEQLLQDYVNGVLTEFQDGSDPVAGQPPYELDVTSTRYSSGAPGQHATTSVAVKVFQSAGGAHPTTWYRAFNYDLTAQAPVTFAEAFPNATDAVAKIWPIVRGDLDRQAGQNLDIPNDTGLDPRIYENFAFSGDSVVFFFDRDAFFGALGAQEVTIPKAQLAGVLDPRFA